MPKLRIFSKEEAVSYVQFNNRVFMQGATMTPNTLIN